MIQTFLLLRAPYVLGEPDFNLFWFMALGVRGHNPSHPCTPFPLSPSLRDLTLCRSWESVSRLIVLLHTEPRTQQQGPVDKISDGLKCRVLVLFKDNGALYVTRSDTLQLTRQNVASPSSEVRRVPWGIPESDADKRHACTKTPMKPRVCKNQITPLLSATSAQLWGRWSTSTPPFKISVISVTRQKTSAL